MFSGNNYLILIHFNFQLLLDRVCTSIIINNEGRTIDIVLGELLEIKLRLITQCHFNDSFPKLRYSSSVYA